MGRLALALVAVVAVTLGFAATAGARPGLTGDPTEPSARLTIRARICPAGFTGPEFSTTCARGLSAAQTFTVSGPETATVAPDADGNAIFADLPAGTYTVEGGVPLEFADLVVGCSTNRPPNLDVAYTPLGGPAPNQLTGIRIDIPAGADLACSFYFLPEDLSGGGSSPSPSASASPAAFAKPLTLPNTGTGAAAVNGVGTTALLLGALAFVGLATATYPLRRRAT